MAKTMSRWREQARQVIEAVIETIPADATISQVRKALYRAYPFGQREHHPYKCWLIEQRRALGVQERKRDRPLGAKFIVRPGLCYIEVDCSGCERKKHRGGINGLIHGCLICRELRADLEKLLNDNSFMAGLATIRQRPMDYGPRGVVADWLEEREYFQLAELVRESLRPKPPKRKSLD